MAPQGYAPVGSLEEPPTLEPAPIGVARDAVKAQMQAAAIGLAPLTLAGSLGPAAPHCRANRRTTSADAAAKSENSS